MNNITIVTKETQQTFLKKYKKKIKLVLIAGGVLVGGILIYNKNKDAITNCLKQFSTQSASPIAIPQTKIVKTITTQYVNVPMYTRNLPVGQKASVLKLEQAAERNIKLAENQTFVREYSYKKAT